ncbi:MAG: tetratricopeptide repeat protein [Gemmatimonadota bacterium]
MTNLDATEDDGRSVRELITEASKAWENDRYAPALDLFQQVLAQHPDFPDVRNKAGLCLAMLGRMEEAIAEFDHALRVNPDYAEAHLNRALILNELGRFDEAQGAFSRAGELDGSLSGDRFPGDLGNRMAVGHARLGDLYLEADEPGRAAEEFREGLAIRPHFVDIRSRLASAYLEMGELGRARRELEEALQRNPEFTAARIRLGVVLQRLGDRDGAIREWSQCQKEDPYNRRLRSFLAGIRAIRENGE